MRIDLERDGVTATAALYYVPHNRGDAHFDDTVSQALYQFHTRPRLDWADLCSRLLCSITPMGVDLITYPPPRTDGEWTASQALADALARMLGVPCQQVCWWAAPPPRDPPGDEVMLRCLGGVDGLRIVVVTDLWRTGSSSWHTAQALLGAGAQWVGAVALAKVVTRQEYEQSEQVRTERGAELAGHAHGAAEYAHNFLKAVGALPTDAEMHGRTLWEQLAVCQRALAAYCEFALRTIGTTATYHPHHDELTADLQALVDRTMAALRAAAFAEADEGRIRRLLGDAEK